jgi:hypothetical protein
MSHFNDLTERHTPWIEPDSSVNGDGSSCRSAQTIAR